jgi:hypothetical protein
VRGRNMSAGMTGGRGTRLFTERVRERLTKHASAAIEPPRRFLV